MPPIVCGLLPVVLIFVALGFPAATAQTLPAADMEAMRSALAAAQSGDWSRAYAVAATITDPLPVKMLRWMDYARPGRPRSLSRNCRVHREEPRVAGAESPAQTCRGGPGRRIGRRRCRVVQALSAGQPDGQGPRSRDDDEFRRSRRRHHGVAARLDRRRFRSSRREEFPCPPFRFASTRGLCTAGRSAAVGRSERGGAPHVGTGALRLPPGGRGSLGARRASRQCRGVGRSGSCAAALGSGAHLRAAALAPQKGHDRCGGPDSARPAQRPRPPGSMVGGTASDCPTRSCRRQRRTCLSDRRAAWPDRRKRVCRSPVPLGLHCAALHEAAGAGVRTLLAHPDAGRHTLRQGASRLLGRTGRRRARQIRPRGEMVRRRGRSHGHLLRAARRTPARARCATAAGAGARTRCRRAGAIRR